MRPEAKDVAGFRLEPWKFGARSAVCISADLELAWASQYVSLERAIEEGRHTRRAFPTLLALFDRFGVPVTWATVGHLFLSSCRKDLSTGLTHAEMLRPPMHRNRYWDFHSGDWYQHDPCSSVEDSPEWYAPDLIDQIRASPVSHEVGSHSFSHTDFSDANCPKDLAAAELHRCQAEASRLGFRLESFVFPGNFEGNSQALRDAGFVCYRGSDGDEITYPMKEKGLWSIPGSLQLFDPAVDYRVRLRHYVDAAVRTRTACHINFHPQAANRSSIERTLAPSLEFLDDRRRRGEVWIATMREIAGFCEARRSGILKPLAAGSRPAFSINWGLEAGRYSNLALTVSLPWSGSTPTMEVDGHESSGPDVFCSVRGGRLFATIEAPAGTVTITRR